MAKTNEFIEIKFGSDINSVLDYFEQLIHKNCALLTISYSYDMYYKGGIFRTGTESHKLFCKTNKKRFYKKLKAPFVYEHTRDKTYNWLSYYSALGKPLGITFNSYDSDVRTLNEEDDSIFMKNHCFTLLYENKNFVLYKYSAKVVKEAHQQNAFTGESFKIREKDIYCGVNDDDIICAFDLI